MKSNKTDDKILTLDEKTSKIVEFKSNKQLKQMTINNQIDVLKNRKNCKIDIKNNDVQLGYYVEFENLKDGNVKCLEFDIISTLNLWFKEK